MSTNCLVTKLKGSVNNDNLEILGTIKVNATSEWIENKELYIGYKTALEHHIVEVADGSSHIIPEGESETVSSLDFYYPKNNRMFNLTPGNYNLIIPDKYDIITLKVYNIDINSLKYCTGLTSITIKGGRYNYTGETDKCTGDLSSLANLTGLRYLRIDSYSVTGDLSAFKDYTDIIEVDIHGNFTGDIANFKKCVNCTQALFINAVNVSGNAENLFSGLYANGKRSGSLSFSILNTSAKFNNQSWTTSFIITFSENGITVTTGGNTIGTYDGSTWTYA